MTIHAFRTIHIVSLGIFSAGTSSPSPLPLEQSFHRGAEGRPAFHPLDLPSA